MHARLVGDKQPVINLRIGALTKAHHTSHFDAWLNIATVLAIGLLIVNFMYAQHKKTADKPAPVSYQSSRVALLKVDELRLYEPLQQIAEPAPQPKEPSSTSATNGPTTTTASQAANTQLLAAPTQRTLTPIKSSVNGVVSSATSLLGARLNLGL